MVIYASLSAVRYYWNKHFYVDYWNIAALWFHRQGRERHFVQTWKTETMDAGSSHKILENSQVGNRFSLMSTKSDQTSDLFHFKWLSKTRSRQRSHESTLSWLYYIFDHFKFFFSKFKSRVWMNTTEIEDHFQCCGWYNALDYCDSKFSN